LSSCSSLFPYTTLFRSSVLGAWYFVLCAYRIRAKYKIQSSKHEALRSLSFRRFGRARPENLSAVLTQAVCERSGPIRGQLVRARSEEHTSELQSRFDLV